MTRATPASADIRLTWFVTLRWIATLGQAALLVSVHEWGHLSVPLGAVAWVLVAELASNVALTVWVRGGYPLPPGALATVMLLDAALLTALLALSGGPFNPFSTLYLVNVALGAVLLPSRWSWTLVAVSLALFASLFGLEALGWPHGGFGSDHAALMGLHLRGMWLAFAVAALLIVYYVHQLTQALGERNAQLEQARSLSARRDKAASLATLAAGAAHELASPLSTVAVAATELDLMLRRLSVPADALEDIALIRSQVTRCRELLQQMAAESGQNAGEPLEDTPVREWLEATVASVSGRERISLEPPLPALGPRRVRGPRHALQRALRNLLSNALQASGGVVTLRVSEEPEETVLRVEDAGAGMSPATLERAGEPFFTTKQPGEGMGLGLFLARSAIESLGGTLSLESIERRGTTATIRLPHEVRPS